MSSSTTVSKDQLRSSAFHDPDATYKLWIMFRDGKRAIFNSYDFRSNNKVKRDPALGLMRLQKYIASKSGLYSMAIIYERISNAVVAKYRDGQQIEAKPTA